ncbi:hypothetical protein Hamer_G000332 [Homarus americanus]|uniref:Uncharacterized protein n=1 Tax=Homarus americanus TaxID=6706 RepID=A0A8J5ND55_HOMAM|nr:hypothetical protein Hamer_G000332 [Homarus americanus]
MGEQRISIPTFNHNVEDWLSHVERSLIGSTATDLQKYTALICALPTDVATQVLEVISNPPAQDKFTTQWTALQNWY